MTSGSTININVGTTPISSWINNQTIHYRYFNNSSYLSHTNIEISPTIFNFTEKYNDYYYLNQYNKNSTNVGTIYRLSTIAYPQSFITSMMEHNFAPCSKNSTGVFGVNSFFTTLCGIYNENTSVLFNKNESQNQINQTIERLVAEVMPNDVFTKQLYNLYYDYSSMCDNQSNIYSNNGTAVNSGENVYNISYNPQESSIVTLSSCQGNKTNPALPYFGDYVKYIMSLSYFMDVINDYTPTMLYYSILYDMKNFNVFPSQKTPELIQSNIGLMGVYPGMIPSGLDVESMLNYSSLGLPINYFKNNNITALTNNGVNISSGVYNDINLFVVIKNGINSYSYYNISTNGHPFSGSLNAGSITYYDSCSGGMGIRTAEAEEIEEMKSSAYKNLIYYDLYPNNVYQNMSSFGNNKYYSYGPSIIGAVPTDVQINNNNVTYGALYYGNITAYKNSTIVPFNENQTLFTFNIPTNAIKYPQNIHQLFAELNSSYSYDMNYYGFNTYFSQPNFTTHYGQYKKKEIVGTGNKTKIITVTCYTSSVSGKMNYNSTKIVIGNKQFNYKNSQKTFVNVSSNLSIKNVFNLNKNGYAKSLNYSYVLYNSSSPLIRSFSNITIPAGSEFQLYTSTHIPLYEFSASYASNTTIFDGGKNLILYAPTYVFPDIYQGINYYYPTISSYANNDQYMTTLAYYKVGLSKNSATSLSGLINFFNSSIVYTILHILGQNITNSPDFQIVNSEHDAEQYYLEGCPYTKIGNICISPPPQYVLNNKQTTSQSDYNLLNPILYTQNMYYSSTQSALIVCLKTDFWKIVLSGIYPAVNSWKGCNYNYHYGGVDEIYYTNMQLMFNESWKNFTPKEKMTFYNYLVNNSTYYNNTYYGSSTINQYTPSTEEMGRVGIYSTVFPPTLSTEKSNLSVNNSMRINNNTANMNISGAYDSMILDECVYDMCYSTNIYPTKVYTMLNYNYLYVGNNTYKVSVYPNKYESESLLLNKTIQNPVSASLFLTYSIHALNSTNFNVNFTAPSTFYIKEITTNKTSMYYSNNTLYIKAPEFTNYLLSLSFSKEQLPPLLNGSFNFIILKQTLTIKSNVSTGYSSTTWLVIISIIIILYILWRIKYFSPIKDSIISNIKKMKGDY